MKRRPSLKTTVSILCAVLLLISPLYVRADEPVPEQAALPIVATGVVISEVQTGKVARADEFIEVFNASDEPLDLNGWQLRYITASESSVKTVLDPSAVIVLAPPVIDGETVLVPSQGYYVLHSGAVALLEGVLGQAYEGMLPATGGSLVLVRSDQATCEFVVEDAVAWGATSHLFGEDEALLPGSTSAKDRLFQRFSDTTGAYVDRQDNAQDFAATDAVTAQNASPGVPGAPVLSAPPPLGSGLTSQQYPDRFANPDCSLPDPPEDPPGEPPVSPPSTTIPPEEEEEETPPPPVIPAANAGLKSPQLSEVLPNPALPQTDASDEFIELYNPNDRKFDLSGYVFEVGLTTKRRFTIPNGTFIEPHAFRAFFSADTRLALSNSGSQAAFVDPLGRLLLQPEPYTTAKDGQSWVFANGGWQWTTRPTPNALNVVSTPVVKRAATVKTAKTTKTTAKPVAVVAPRSGDAGSKQANDQAASLAATTRSPLHPSVLALIGVSAVLYGAYEYRRDVANRIYQFRANRAARAALRQSTKGR